MKYLITALLLSISMPAFADNIAGCEVVLMEKIKQEDSEGVTEVASFRPAADFIASIYDDDTEVLRKIDGLPIRAIMCKRQSIVPSLRDFSIVATGTPFMISQNFDSTESGLTTIYFKEGEFHFDYKGAELDADTQAEMKDRLDVFNLQPHDLAEKEKAMLAKKEETTEDISEPEKEEEASTEMAETEDDTPSESTDTVQDAQADEDMDVLTPEELKDAE
jgi:hypothetical protein